MNKQIEEMAKHCHFRKKRKCLLLEDEGVGCDMKCDMYEFAERLYNAGYRKQSEGEWLHKNNPNTDIYERRPISVCSVCGFERIGDTKFCEECGAHMRGGNKDE